MAKDPASKSSQGVASEAFLDVMKRTADPFADGTVSGIFQSGRIALINELLTHLDGNDQAIPTAFPENVARYLQSSGILPPWADVARIKKAQDLFLLHGPVFGVVLMLRSLPALYAGSLGGAQVLNMTGQLTHNFRRRASETLRFILDAMEPDGLGPKGRGRRTVQKVRLMHATIRLFATRSGEWPKHPDWGAPINQEELVGTLMAFAYLAVDGVRRLGVKVSEIEAEDFLHAWKCIGFMLGLREDAFPKDMREAAQIWAAVARRNFKSTPEGLILMREHVKFIQDLILGHLADGLVESLMRYLMGTKIACGALGLPKAGWLDRLVFAIRWLLRLEARWLFQAKFMDKWLEEASRDLMESLDAYWGKGGPPPFRLPETLSPHT